MKLIALVETIPADNSGTGERHVEEMTAEADTYEDAVADLRSRVAEGWRLVNFRRADYGTATDQYGRTVR